MLRYLNESNIRINHTIQVLQEIPIETESIIVVPMYHRGIYSHSYLPQNDAFSLALQFVEGIVFLYQLRIAHLDIKPSNAVVDEHSRRLYIIDFSLSKQFSGEDDMIEGFRETEGWTAPEIGENKGVTRCFSAKRADGRTCGKVVQFIYNRTEERSYNGKCLLDTATVRHVYSTRKGSSPSTQTG